MKRKIYILLPAILLSALSASGGIYDFEQEWKGQQGEFSFLGIDPSRSVSRNPDILETHKSH